VVVEDAEYHPPNLTSLAQQCLPEELRHDARGVAEGAAAESGEDEGVASAEVRRLQDELDLHQHGVLVLPPCILVFPVQRRVGRGRAGDEVSLEGLL
jgi:hypothetical protein